MDAPSLIGCWVGAAVILDVDVAAVSGLKLMLESSSNVLKETSSLLAELAESGSLVSSNS